MVAQILKTTLHLPDRIQAICWIQFWAWIGWFPFLFYSTTWVGETYFRYDAPKDAQQSSDMLGEIGRVGSLSLVVFSVISFAGSVTLPWVVKAPENENTPFTPRPPPSIGPLVSEMAKYKPDLLTAWMISHLIFAAAMILAPFVTSLRFATTIVSVCGIPWALACWAPFAFMGVEINRVSASTSSSYHRLSDTTPASPIELEEGVPQHHHLIPTVPESPTVLRITHNTDPAPSSAASSATAAPSNSTGELAGIYLGILNLYTTLPQFLGTFISMIVFSVLEPGKSPELAIDVDDAAAAHDTGGEEGVNGIAVCLFIGALSALGAAWATYRLRKRGI
ncbi:MAG: hypothetical protein M1819_002811 [Sarea resinae]|nr:MAG: hypothetical protein M1819_002811 [Sarea resinae]